MTLSNRISFLLNKAVKMDKIISQVELAKVLGVAPASVNKWLNGGSPSIDKLPMICELLHISPNELFDYKQEIPKEAIELYAAFSQYPEYKSSICKLLGLILTDLQQND